MSKIEYRSVIKFLFKEGNSPAVIKDRLDGVYGESSPSYSTVKNWVKEFRFGRETIEDEGHEGRPVDMLTPETIAAIEEEVLNYRRLKIREIAVRLGLTKSAVHHCIHDHLHMNKVSARWVPKLLSAVQREERVRCASAFLELCGETTKKYLIALLLVVKRWSFIMILKANVSRWSGVMREKNHQERQKCNSPLKK